MPKQTDSIELTNSLQGTVEYTASQEIIPEEKILQHGDFTYTTNGERTENPSEGYDGFDTVAVNVNVQPVLQSKSVSYTENNDYTISPDDGYQGLSAVNVSVNVSGGGVFPETPSDAVIFYSPNEFSIKTNNAAKNWDGTLYYSTDYSSWNEWNGTDTLTSAKTGDWHKLYVKGSGNGYLTGGNSTSYSTANWVIRGATIKCCGNLSNLLDTTSPSMSNYGFTYLFYNCKFVDFDVTLPTVNNKNYAFAYMFRGCESLVKCPELSSTTLVSNCYDSMFENCINLKTASSLPATVCGTYCYQYMFKGCTSLITPPTISATTLNTSCYRSMFEGCTSLTSAPVLPATTLAQQCYYNMFYGCTSLTTAPELPATTLGQQCYQGMFQGCTSLTTAPELPATTLTLSCYYNMFYGCTSLVTPPILSNVSTVSQSAYYNMFNGCTSLTSIPKIYGATFNKYACYGMFANCSNIKLSTEQTGEYQNEYRIPTSGEATAAGADPFSIMFQSTGGTFTGTPTINTTYYTSNTVIPAN